MKIKLSLRKTLAVSVFAVLPFGSGWATTINSDFNTAPADDGWSYIAEGNSALESDVFSISNGILTMNTIGQPLVGSGGNQYVIYDAFDPAKPFAINMRARLLGEEGYFDTNSFGLAMSVYTGTEAFGIGIGSNGIQDMFSQVIATVDTSIFHDYTLYATPGAGYQLYIDGTLAATGATRYIDYVNRIAFGDSTGGVNTHAEIASISFIQVPTPGAFALLAAGLCGTLIAKRRAKPTA